MNPSHHLNTTSSVNAPSLTTLLGCIIMLPVFGLLKVFNIRVKFYDIPNRIGHLAGNIELYICGLHHRPLNKKERHFFFYPPGVKSANTQLDRMWKRNNVHISIFNYYLYAVFRILKHTPNQLMLQTTDRDVDGLLERTPQTMRFTSEETITAYDQLNACKISPTDSIICIATRDAAYLNKTHHTPQIAADAHRFRNCNIDHYTLAIQQLLENGHTVIRMGSIVEKPLTLNHPKFIEYSTSSLKSELMDIFIPSICTYFISCGTGLDAISSYLFRRPNIYANISHIGYLNTWENSIAIFKKTWCNREKRLLSIAEIRKKGACCFMTTHDFEQAGLTLIENTAEEIHELIIEKEQRATQQWVVKDDEVELQKQFWSIYRAPCQTEHDSHCMTQKNKIFHLKIGYWFLKNNSFLLDPMPLQVEDSTA